MGRGRSENPRHPPRCHHADLAPALRTLAPPPHPWHTPHGVPHISKKKLVYPVRHALRRYLVAHARANVLPVRYDDLLRYDETTPVYDKQGRDTLWETVLYPPSERRAIYKALVRTYALLRVKGDLSLMKHLVTDRVDVCSYGNTQPFRVRILNEINENFDYFYVKRADASRIYGLELEHLLSPNRIEFLYDDETLIEEHISGLPGDVFCREYLDQPALDEVRVAKEFVKFNERCFVRLLGDMHSGNWVVDITPDFDETVYRIRAIDFDQQSYEGRYRVYMPQYYKENNPLIELGIKCMTPETVKQYQHEERTLTVHRMRSEQARLDDFLRVMANDRIAPDENVEELREGLGYHYDDPNFLQARSMGDLVRLSLLRVAADPRP